MLAGYCGSSGSLDEALSDFALSYADQTEADHEVLCQAIKRGKLPALKGV
jgi:hypothetical protein